jgi:CBS domain-containing protein
MKIRDLLAGKDAKYRVVATVEPNENISVAIQKMVTFDRGAISVCNENGELLGIITERDIVRKCFTSIAALENVKVENIMTEKVAMGHPEDDLDYAISVMKQKRIRHLPIVDNQVVMGMISMRDLIGVQLAEYKAEIRYTGLLRGEPHHRRRRLV